MTGQGELQDLCTYLAAAAQITGSEDISANGEPTGQATHSLAWYFERLLAHDLDRTSPSYSALLDAYLHENSGNALQAGQESPSRAREIDRKLATCFPQSAYPLNASQTRAVHRALVNPLTIIIGPPGTGKTETILRILAMAIDQGESVAMVSSNHSAVNTVIEKVMEARVEGQAPASDLMAVLAERLVPLGNARDREQARDANGASYGFSTRAPKGKARLHVDLAMGWEQRIALQDFCKGPNGPRCVTSTIHSLKKCFADGDVAKFDLVVIDEASQSSALLGIVALSSARRVVIVGDDEQLPPVIDERLGDSLAKKCGQELVNRFSGTAFDVADAAHPTSFLGSCRTVFSAGADDDQLVEVMLNEHYRCHPAIIGFCNEYVYDNKLQVKTKISKDAPAFPIGVRWYDGDYREPDVRWEKDRSGAGHWRSSVCNMRQVSIIEREELPHIEALVKAGKSICFLSPFWAQVDEIARLIRERVPEVADALGYGIDSQEETGGDDPHGEEECALTVHRSQGKEFDCVYLLPVEDGKWAWPWSQGRRLVNVAVSRAKEELHVIVSTKLMYEEDQRALTGRVVTRDPLEANSQDEEAERENLFVCKLVRYVREHAEASEAADQPAWCGMRHTAVSSVFDWSANLLGAPHAEDEDVTSVPELLVGCGLSHVDAMSERGLSVATGVRLDKLLFNGKSLQKRARIHFNHPDKVHFDFVVYERASRRVVALVEVDGAQHRFAGFADSGSTTYVRRNMATELQRDWEKESLVRELGGTCVWLGAPRGHQLTKTIEYHDRPKVIPGDRNADGALLDGSEEDRIAGWVGSPEELQSTSRFLFIRIPCDGSTAFEFDTLARANASGQQAPTIDGFLRAQLQQGFTEDSLVISKNHDTFCSGRRLPKKKISDISSRLGIGPVEANRCLVEMGILANAEGGEKRPTDLGEYLGISVAQPKGASYRMPVYDEVAQRVLETLLRSRLCAHEVAGS